jgi:arsenate reductase (thioredoxin)
MVKILFVCYGNSCRSQMAEALANRLGGGKIQASSAGTHPLGEISVDTRAVLGEKGMTLEGHWSKGLEDVPVSDMDVVVEMGFGVKCKLPPDFKGRLVKWQIPDPFSLGLEHFRDVRGLIESEVRKLLAELAVQDSKLENRNSKTANGNSAAEGGGSARES